MDIDPKKFLEDVNVEKLDALRRVDYISLAKYFAIPVKAGSRKQRIKNAVIGHMVENEIIGEEALALIIDIEGDAIALKELELRLKEADASKEIRLKELELASKEKETETRLRLEYEVKMKELELSHRSTPDPPFDVTKNIRLIPKFSEKDVDKFFPHFEKIAINLKWPKEHWSLLLQSVFIGKAREIFSALSLEKSSDYDEVKRVVLKAYELVPEAYRQKFRLWTKLENQTYVEFSREKEQMFDRWINSTDVDGKYDNLRELMLLEEFKQCVHSEIKTHLDDNKVNTLSRAATMADDYALTHKLASKAYRRDAQGKKPGGASSQPDVSSQPKEGDADKGCRTGSGAADRVHKTGSDGLDGRPKEKRSCYYCGKVGHLTLKCFKKKRDMAAKAQPTACMSLRTPIASEMCVPEGSKSDEIMDKVKPFVSDGSIALNDGNFKPIKVLRDTACVQSCLLQEVLPFSEESYTGSNVLITGIEGGEISVPLHVVNIKSKLVSGKITVGVRSKLPFEGIHLLMGNDLAGHYLAGGEIVADPIVSNIPYMDKEESSGTGDTDFYPSCAVTRSMNKKLSADGSDEFPLKVKSVDTDIVSGLEDTFMSKLDSDDCQSSDVDSSPVDVSKNGNVDVGEDSLTREKLKAEQKKDPEIVELFKRSLSLNESDQVPVCYYMKDGLLMRKWRPPEVAADDEWAVVHQIVVPKKYRRYVINIAHDTPLSGHLGVNKTYQKVLSHFYWPKIKNDIFKYCRSCHTCQVVGKPNQTIPNAPLYPIPAFDEPFSRILIDCVGPLPKAKSGNEYLLTIMCTSTRFPEAIPLRNIKAKTIVKTLVEFFTRFGLPKAIQSDQGSNFMSNLFKQVMERLGIKHYKSSAYHPESQGALERFHQTLKNMMRCYCFDNEKDWDEGIPMLLFAARESVQESLGFSPFELVFGHSVRGPLKLLKEKWMCEEDNPNLLMYVSTFQERLAKVSNLAKQNLKKSQRRMKKWYDRDVQVRVFRPGEKVLVLLPCTGNPLRARYFGPYEVESKVNDLNYIVKTPGRRKSRQLCHINMIKVYVNREDDPIQPVACTVPLPVSNAEQIDVAAHSMKLKNSDVLADLGSKIGHLKEDQQQELSEVFDKYKDIFSDVPGQTTLLTHDVDVGDAAPIKQYPYRVNPFKLEAIREEIRYMKQNNIIEESDSDWSSPCVLVPKPDGSYRFCTDYRKVNKVSRTDSYPIPRIEDCIDDIGKAKFVTKIDLMKGFWQVPLTERAKKISAFVTPDGLYQYRVMPFGMKNSSATFQRLMNKVISGLRGVKVYIDDLVVFSDTWEGHVARLKALFDRLLDAGLTVNLVKSEFGCATVEYLGHVVGQGQIKPRQAKIEAIVNFPIPKTKRELMRFLGMAGFYRKFCRNFSVVVHPLTSLLCKSSKFKWSDQCNQAFNKVKAVLTNSPVLVAVDYEKPFKLMVDASDVGAGSVLMQESVDGIEHPVGFFSKKFNQHQRRYSTIEKECLAIVLSLQHYDVYLCATMYPVLVLTDHNPLTFLDRMKEKNQRILRWSLLIQEYNLSIQHVKGKDNVIADALSRSK